MKATIYCASIFFLQIKGHASVFFTQQKTSVSFKTEVFTLIYYSFLSEADVVSKSVVSAAPERSAESLYSPETVIVYCDVPST